MNALRDSLLETVPAKATIPGQIPYVDGINSVAMLNFAANSILRAGSRSPEWDSLLRSTITNLNDGSNDNKVPVWSVVRGAFLPKDALFSEFRNNFNISSGVGVNVDLPTGRSLTDFRYLMHSVGSSSTRVDETLIYRRASIPTTIGIYMNVAQSSNTRLRLTPRRSGHVHTIVGIL